MRGCRGWGRAWLQGGGACVGYDEIRSMSGRYASYWNAFLFSVRTLFFSKVWVDNCKWHSFCFVIISYHFELPVSVTALSSLIYLFVWIVLAD